MEDIVIKKHEVGIIENKNVQTSNVMFVNAENIVEINNKDIQIFNPQKTGDLFEYKVCNRCHRLLPVANFANNQNAINNRKVKRPSWNECRAKIDGHKVSNKEKSEWAKTKPDFEIWECPICKKRTIPGLTSKVVLDHNHNNGKPRAWICDSCNTGLGRFKDDIETMQTAINYLLNEDNT